MNLKQLKEVSISWSVKKKSQDIKDLVHIEFSMMGNLKKMGFGFNTEEDKFSLVEPQTRKRTILCDWEKEPKQKSRALWMYVEMITHIFSIKLLLIGKI